MKEEKKFKRSFWRVVNREMEIQYPLVVVWLMIIGFLVSGLMTYLTIWNNILLMPQMLSSPEQLLVMQKRILQLLGIEFLAGGVIMMVLAAILQFRFLHRIAGPLFRLENMLKDLSKGKLPSYPIVFRQNDLCKGLAEAFNQLVSAIKSGTKFEN
ncbi:MAG: hypothetical protein V2A65_12045 [Candidatus Omnitrophota bacterium]